MEPLAKFESPSVLTESMASILLLANRFEPKMAKIATIMARSTMRLPTAFTVRAITVS